MQRTECDVEQSVETTEVDNQRMTEKDGNGRTNVLSSGTLVCGSQRRNPYMPVTFFALVIQKPFGIITDVISPRREATIK